MALKIHNGDAQCIFTQSKGWSKTKIMLLNVQVDTHHNLFCLVQNSTCTSLIKFNYFWYLAILHFSNFSSKITHTKGHLSHAIIHSRPWNSQKKPLCSYSSPWSHHWPLSHSIPMHSLTALLLPNSPHHKVWAFNNHRSMANCREETQPQAWWVCTG